MRRALAELGRRNHECREGIIPGTDGEPQEGETAGATQGYRCFLLDGSGRVVARHELTATRDDTAMEEAGRVLAGSVYNQAELWQLARFIRRLGKLDGG